MVRGCHRWCRVHQFQILPALTEASQVGIPSGLGADMLDLCTSSKPLESSSASTVSAGCSSRHYAWYRRRMQSTID